MRVDNSERGDIQNILPQGARGGQVRVKLEKDRLLYNLVLADRRLKRPVLFADKLFGRT